MQPQHVLHHMTQGKPPPSPPPVVDRVNMHSSVCTDCIHGMEDKKVKSTTDCNNRLAAIISPIHA
jgi:hypothetical protein